MPFYAWTIFALLLWLVVALHLSSKWALIAGLCLGMAGMALRMLPDALMPGFITNWQLGAWGEENTAIELKQLARTDWVVRHDVKWGDRGNHDHLVAGPAIYVLNTKNLKDSSVSVEGDALRVRRLDDPQQGYLADRWVPRAEDEARYLHHKLGRTLGFRVYVHPVVVVWGEFDAEQAHIRKVSIVRGDKLATWIASRPVDISDAAKRKQLAEYVRSMPHA